MTAEVLPCKLEGSWTALRKEQLPGEASNKTSSAVPKYLRLKSVRLFVYSAETVCSQALKMRVNRSAFLSASSLCSMHASS